MAKFEEISSQRTRQGILPQLWYFVWRHKKFCLLPPILALMLVGLLILLSGTAAAPFIYTLF
jgi:hypothetical protein